jgi:VanZ family protein
VALAGMLLTVVVLLAHQYLPSHISDLAHEAIRSLHGPGFGLVALLMLMLLREKDRPLVAYVQAATFAMVLAAAAEAAQIPGPREAELGDLLTDALGIIAFLGIAAVFDRRIRVTIGKQRVWLMALISIPVLVLTLTPTVWLSYALIKRQQAMPQLLTFDKSWEQTYSSGVGGPLELIDAPDGWPEGSGKIARLHSAGKWGLMLHIRPHPDWSEYSAVSFVAATSNEDMRRIALGLWGIKPDDGSAQGRYYTRASVTREPARYCILFEDLNTPSSTREFDLTQVYELLVGDLKDEIGVELLVDDFRLEKNAANCPSG